MRNSNSGFGAFVDVSREKSEQNCWLTVTSVQILDKAKGEVFEKGLRLESFRKIHISLDFV